MRTHPGYAGFHKRALDSIRAQELNPSLWHLVIVSDGELEAADAAELKELCADFPVHVTDHQLKAATGYYTVPTNAAITFQTRAPYLAFMDADNEIEPNHLSGLLRAMRTPGPDWLPHFAYTRIKYVRDADAPDDERKQEGESPLVPWTAQTAAMLTLGPRFNFIDSGSLMIARSALYWLAEATGQMWNPDVNRFGDWDIAARMASIGFRGRPVDQLSNVYHWHGNNLQGNRPPVGLEMISEELYEQLKAQGKLSERA